MKLLFSTVYKGPNRRSDSPLVEQLIGFSEVELRRLDSHRGQFMKALAEKLQGLGLISEPGEFPFEPVPDAAIGFAMSLMAQIGLILQRRAGHDVNYFTVGAGPGERQGWMLFEHEDSDVAVKAAGLIPLLIGAAPSDPGQLNALRDSVRDYLRFAASRALPGDTRIIAEVAEKRGIPVTKLDRDPYVERECEGVDPNLRVRPNGRLMLGFGVNRRIVDGTFSPDQSRNLVALVTDRAACLDLVGKLGFPVIPAEAEEAVEGADSCQVILADGQPVCTFVKNPGDTYRPHSPDGLHPSYLRLAERVAQNVEAGVISLTLSSPDFTEPMEETGGRITGLDLAPELDQLIQPGSSDHRAVLGRFVDWLYPMGKPSRIPIVAVTGTNGKTTTARMIRHIVDAAGYRTGLVCTEGVFLDGDQVHEGDMASRPGHLRVLESEKVDFAVLEAHHRGMRLRGQAFDRCDVAVCLNVTADHIEKHGMETVERIAEVKRSLLERAGEAVVINADNRHCLAMVPHLSAKHTCLVSMQCGIERLRGIVQGEECFCVIDDSGGNGPKIVLWQNGEIRPVLRVDEVPATHGGTAEFNVSNAMHAIAAAHLAGIGLETIRAAMSSFGTDFESTPGRMNIHDGPLFRTVLDFAHNYDGHRKLAAWVEKQDVAGRKILLISVPGDRDDKEIVEVGSAPAGSYDHYICRPFLNLRGRQPGEVSELLKRGLVDSGVPEERITVETDFDAAMLNALRMGRKGDLIVLCNPPAKREEAWETIRSFVPGATSE